MRINIFTLLHSAPLEELSGPENSSAVLSQERSPPNCKQLYLNVTGLMLVEVRVLGAQVIPVGLGHAFT